MTPKRDNADWLNDLQSPGEAREVALSDLMPLLQRTLPAGLSRWLSPDNPLFDDLVADVIQETLLRVLDNLHTFEGRSQFTTWVYKIAVRVALNELRRRRWREVSLDGLNEDDADDSTPRQFSSSDPSPESITERAEILKRVQIILAEELTERQRAAMNAIHMQGVPMEEVARRMGTNRNALYKLMHDARLRLKRRLEREGLNPKELLEMLGQ